MSAKKFVYNCNWRTCKGVAFVELFFAMFKRILIWRTLENSCFEQDIFFDFGKVCFVSAFEVHFVIKCRLTTMKINVNKEILAKKMFFCSKKMQLLQLLAYCQLLHMLCHLGISSQLKL